MSNGLAVVSIGIPVVEKSLLSKNLFLYKENRPELIAEAIKIAGNSNINNDEVIVNLNNDFIASLKGMINDD